VRFVERDIVVGQQDSEAGESLFDGVQRRLGFSLCGDGAGGVLRIGLVGSDLLGGGHVSLSFAGAAGVGFRESAAQTKK
jgi:hypothetical protein